MTIWILVCDKHAYVLYIIFVLPCAWQVSTDAVPVFLLPGRDVSLQQGQHWRYRVSIVSTNLLD